MRNEDNKHYKDGWKSGMRKEEIKNISMEGKVG